HARLRYVDRREVAAQHVLEKFAQGAGCLDTRGSAPDDDEVERATLDESRIRTDPLELADDMIAQRNRVVEALQLQRVLGDAGYAERVRGRPGGEDEE